MLEITEIDTFDQILELEPHWNHILQRSSSNNIFLTWEWISTCWRNYNNNRRLNTLLIKDRDSVEGILPLALTKTKRVKKKRLEFIGVGVSDYQDFILTDKKNESINVLIGYFQEHKENWDVIDLQDVPENSSSLLLCDSSTKQGYKTKETIQSICPYLPIKGTWENYFDSLSKNMRGSLRRTRKRLAEAYTVEFHICNERDSLEDLLQHFFRLHKESWRERKGQNSVLTPIFEKFHTDMAKLLFERGWLNLSFIMADNVPIASIYGAEYNKKFYYFLMGFDPEYSKYGVGQLLFKHLIKYCFDKGLQEFDFLKGDEPYKYRWTKSNRKNLRVEIVNKRISSKLYDLITKLK